ncbi:MAG TPA: hypothetical protein VKE22_24005 [Haliangiales bacterium]|nr:hypothetical protein [Haliangiales bacterium]
MRGRAIFLFVFFWGCWGLWACASHSARQEGLAEIAAGRTEPAIRALRRAVAEDPGDRVAHAALGDLLARAGEPAGALRELREAERLGGASPAQTKTLADLYAARAARRGDDPGRYRDLDEAARLDPARAPGLAEARKGAWRDAALLHLGAGDVQRARALWAQAGEPADALAGAGAEAQRRRATPPPLARGGEPASGEAIAQALAEDVRAWLRGETATWPSPDVAAAVVRDAGDVAPWARPTVLRLRGDAKGAHAARGALPRDLPAEGRLVAAMDAALAGEPDEAERILGVPAGVEGHLARATILRIARRAGAESRAVRSAIEADRATAWPFLYARGDAEILLGQKGSPPGGGAWARFLEISAVDSPMSLGRVTPRALPLAEAGCAPGDEAFLAFRQALGTPDAPRLAADYADGDLLPRCRVPHVVRELQRAGDAAAALAWAERLADELPEDAQAQVLAAEASARARDPRRAAVFLTRAEYVAPRRGAPSLAVARLLRASGLPIDALTAARQALSLGAEDIRWDAYDEVVAAALAAGRAAEARAAWDAYQAELPERLRADAALRVRAALGATAPPDFLPPPPAPASTGPGDVADALARARARQDAGDNAGAAAVLDDALRYVPGVVELRLARADLEPPGRPARRKQEEALLLVGLAHDDARGRAALTALARLWREDGRDDMAAAARAEAALVGAPD